MRNSWMTILVLFALALSTCAAAAQHHPHHHHHRVVAVAHHRAIPPDAFAQASPPQAPKIIPLPRARPFAALWQDRVIEAIGGRW